MRKNQTNDQNKSTVIKSEEDQFFKARQLMSATNKDRIGKVFDASPNGPLENTDVVMIGRISHSIKKCVKHPRKKNTFLLWVASGRYELSGIV